MTFLICERTHVLDCDYQTQIKYSNKNEDAKMCERREDLLQQKITQKICANRNRNSEEVLCLKHEFYTCGHVNEFYICL